MNEETYPQLNAAYRAYKEKLRREQRATTPSWLAMTVGEPMPILNEAGAEIGQWEVLA